MPFQIVRVEVGDAGEVLSRRSTEPLFELRDHAMAMAGFDAARGWCDYDYDRERDCWWTKDDTGRLTRFVVEPVPLSVAEP